MSAPLVSAIMPTRGRRALVTAAVECFIRQDWPNKELVVVDDPEDPIGDLLPTGHRIAYCQNAKVHSIGYKRNQACSIASGEYIVHFDSDDWSGPQRISEQVRALRQSSRPATGYNTLPFAWDEGWRAWLYLGRQGYACGTSLCYLRAYWAGHRFKDVQIGEDNEFIRGLGERFLSLSGRSIVARVHGGATCPKIEMLTSTAWSGAVGQSWQEIDYGQLAQCGYPCITEVVRAGTEEPAHDGSRDSRDGDRRETDMDRAAGGGHRSSPDRSRSVRRARRRDSITAG